MFLLIIAKTLLLLPVALSQIKQSNNLYLTKLDLC